MSNRRKIKRQHPAAHLDGLHLEGACCDAILRVTGRKHGLHAADVLHDEGCDFFSDDPAVSFAARMTANLAMSRATGQRVAVVTVVGDAAVILLPDRQEP